MYNSLWYINLNKPPFAPPDWIFTPVWIFLYIMIFISLALYISTPVINKREGYLYFSFQMFLNFLWSPIFFYFQNILAALVIITLMDIFLVLTIIKFYNVSKLSSTLLIPYFLWIIFATYLNIAYLALN